MIYIYFLYYIIILTFCLSFIACDPVHISKFRVVIPISTAHDADLSIDIDRMTDALNAIDSVVTRHGMVRKNEACKIQNGLIYRYYFGEYQTHGIASSSQKSVRLKIAANNKTGDLTIEISDLFSTTHSQLSQSIRRDLVDVIKQKYGEISIRSD